MAAITPTATNTSTSLIDTEPVILTGWLGNDRCGHAAVVAFDGHELRSTPHLAFDEPNFLELLSEGAVVDLIDCQVWTDAEQLSWIAVRTAAGKLGWMMLQPDKLYVTLEPVAQEVVRPVTALPSGDTLAYVPPAVCPNESAPETAVATSIGVDFIPVIGDLKGLREAATGCDAVTGEDLGDWRWLGLLGIVGLAELRHLGHADEAAVMLRQGDEIAVTVGRQGDEATGLARQTDEGLDVGSDGAGEARHADEPATVARSAGRLEAAPVTAGTVRNVDEVAAALPPETLAVVNKLGQPCSFSADTPVLTPTGLRAISEIAPGDQVLASEGVNARGVYTVTAAFSHLDARLLLVVVSGEPLLTTPEHPFALDEGWRAAGELRVGDEVWSASDPAGVIELALPIRRTQRMYNLTVAVAHNYFVGEGGWLVHNACSQILRRNLDSAGAVPVEWQQEHVAWQAHHIIPGQWEKNDFVAEAIKGGWKIDGADNGIALPATEAAGKRYRLPVHRGYHPSYSNRVNSELTTLAQRAEREQWDPARKATELDKLAQRLRSYILAQPDGQRLN